MYFFATSYQIHLHIMGNNYYTQYKKHYIPGCVAPCAGM